MKTKMKMVNKNGYWTDRHGNGWSVTVNTKEQAIEKSRSLIDCYACVDCYDCRDCNG